VGLTEAELVAVARVRQTADSERGEVEGAGRAGPLGGRVLFRLNAAATAELDALIGVLGPARAVALRESEREAYRVLLAAHENDATPTAIEAFIQRRMLFLRMGGPPAAARPDPANLSAAR
jgi:hypothetical protein